MQYESPRQEYRRGALTREDMDADPLVQFEHWLQDAVNAEVPEPTAMTLATADGDGRPSARNVLLKGLDERGFAFYTNLGSRKAQELRDNPRAALVFRWQELERQVCVLGDAEQLAGTEADAYFASRPRGSQLAAWASPQSQVIADRRQLEARFEELERAYADVDVPRPPEWGGFLVRPVEVEFWQGRFSLLHDRLRYRSATGDEAAGGAWSLERLGP